MSADAEFVGPEPRYTLRELCMVCGIQTELAVEMVVAGVIEAEGARPGSWRFSAADIEHAKKALRLRRDLGVDDWTGLALALDLLDEIARLRARLALFERR